MARAAATFLMFQEGDAEEAMNVYVGLFPGSRIRTLERYGPGEPGPEGTVKRAEFTVAGHEMMAFDSPMKHAFGFTPAVSLFIVCENEAELDAAFARLSEGGQVMMPVDAYEFSPRFGWALDRFGVSWQLSLA